MTADEMLRRVLYRDADVLIFDKPAGLPVHKGTTTDDDLEAHFRHLCFGNAAPPRLAHRLDKPTSGCLVLGRTDEALTLLGRLFARQRVAKTYWAVTAGIPQLSEDVISAPLRKLARPEGARMEVCADGQTAVTDYRVLATARGLALLELSPRTGRTHQLRAHCAAIGTPILGDALYGGAPGVVHLHSRSVVFTLYRDATEIAAQAPLPDHMAATFDDLGWRSPLGFG